MYDMVRRGSSIRVEAQQAAAELAEQLAGPGMNAVVFFCSPAYDLDGLAKALHRHFDCPVVGCTTAGEILSPAGYMENSLVGVGFASADISMTPVLIPDLKAFVDKPDPSLIAAFTPSGVGNRFGLIMIDGLSMLEERVAAVVQTHLRDVPLIGGSAGDGLRFRRTNVYCDGQFHHNAAVLALFTTNLPFRTFQIQHFLPTETKLVITEADVSNRMVTEINGLPASAEYARIVGSTADALSAHVFAAHPLMLRVGGKYYVRSIQKADPNGGLTFYCAIDIGMVLTLARPSDLLENLQRQLEALSRDFPGLQLVLGCDCILRRLELDQLNQFNQAKSVLASYPFVGFSTYGEQYNGLHINQTLTGIALGAPHEPPHG